ncbi:hypothetical protein [Streptomyces anatolicus]|uniref:hypothetical protein n=1 Tax=Streptomyces anatolicus TaxID=2675858 RepID=UPI002154F997|nr:hypothetical protein [Streptomyces anatolicus]
MGGGDHARGEGPGASAACRGGRSGPAGERPGELPESAAGLYSLDHERRLYAAAADLERMRAWALFDVHGSCNDRIFKSALQSAHSAGDPGLGAHILTFWAAAAYNCDRPAEAESMASAALSTVRSKAAPFVEALAYAGRARARSHLGDERCWSDLDFAERHLHAPSRTRTRVSRSGPRRVPGLTRLHPAGDGTPA